MVYQSPDAAVFPQRRGRGEFDVSAIEWNLIRSRALDSSSTHLCAGRGPFGGMVGSWAGGGAVALTSGTKEHLRCRATYKVGNGGRPLQLSIRCVSDSYNFHLTGSVVDPDGTVSGTLTESGHNVGGTVLGRESGGTIQAVASSGSFSAGITLVTHGNRQSLTIRPSAGTDVTTVSVTLAKR
jgi:hypothetical protein